MPAMRSGPAQPAQRPVLHALPRVLRAAGGEHGAGQAPGAGDAGGHCAPQAGAWPGSDLGVRAPFPGECALSWAEVLHGWRAGLLGGFHAV